MKIAIPTRNNKVDEHFGHCEYYTLVSVSEKNEVTGEEFFEAPQGCGCKSNIAGILKEKGVEVMLAGNMGQGAVNKVAAAGIKVYRGCSGEVRPLVEAFLRQEIADSGEICDHHDHDHHHNHGHQH